MQGCAGLFLPSENEGGFMRETSLLASVSYSNPQTFEKLLKSAGKAKPRTAGGKREGGRKVHYFLLPSQLPGEGGGEKESSDLGRGHSESEAPSGT